MPVCLNFLGLRRSILLHVTCACHFKKSGLFPMNLVTNHAIGFRRPLVYGSFFCSGMWYCVCCYIGASIMNALTTSIVWYSKKNKLRRILQWKDNRQLSGPVGWGCRQFMQVNEKKWQKGLHSWCTCSESLTFCFICLYLACLPKDQPPVHCYHSNWATTPITCPVFPLFNHFITIVNMQHSLLGQLEDVCSKLLQNVGACVPFCTTSYHSHIPKEWIELS